MPEGNADLAQGARLYGQLCLACHGDKGTGGQGNGASLVNASRDIQLLANTAWNGRNNAMPPFRGTLTPEQLRDIAQYITQELFGTHAE